MEMDVLILSAIVFTLFVVFIIAVVREFKVMESEPYKFQKESGPRAGLVNFVGNLVANKSLSLPEKESLYNAMNRNIADMESDGVYFDEVVKDLIREKIEELKNQEQNNSSEGSKNGEV
jgi:hypothetical protein